MRLIKKVSLDRVKRVFVVAQQMRLYRKKGTKYLPKLKRSEFIAKITKAKSFSNKLKKSELDKRIVSDGTRKRLKAYEHCNWFLAEASVNELGVWRRAGGLPSDWTCCSLSQTAGYIKKALANNSKLLVARSKRSIPRIMEFADIIGSDEYLFPIVFKGGTGTKGRAFCRKKMKGDIDDGCMRAIALTLLGAKTLKIYFGKPVPKGASKLV